MQWLREHACEGVVCQTSSNLGLCGGSTSGRTNKHPSKTQTFFTGDRDCWDWRVLGQEWQLCAARLAWFACLTFFILLKEGVRARDLLLFFFFSFFSFLFSICFPKSEVPGASRLLLLPLAKVYTWRHCKDSHRKWSSWESRAIEPGSKAKNLAASFRSNLSAIETECLQNGLQRKMFLVASCY